MQSILTQAPTFSTRTPTVLNSSNKLTFAIPVLNTGSGTAENMTVTSITCGSNSPLSPAMPFVLGVLGADNSIIVSASFAAANFAVGSKYLATIRGTYEADGATFGFTLNRFITIPASVPAPIPLLAAHVDVSVDLVASTWSYTIFNDETSSSPRFVSALSIEMVAPFTVTNTPSGWAADTDNMSYVLWYATDVQLPYPHQIAPGASLAGFKLTSPRMSSESRGLVISSWNHQSDQADLSALGDSLVPARS